MRLRAVVFCFIACSLFAQSPNELPARVQSELSILGEQDLTKAVKEMDFEKSVLLLASRLQPVREGKFKNPDPAHRRFVARVRLLRLMTKKDQTLDLQGSHSKFKNMFPDGKIACFWLWMSRDVYYFPAKIDQKKLIGRWKDGVSQMKPEQPDLNLDINEWWF